MIDDEVEEFELIRGGVRPCARARAGESAIGLKRGERSFGNASLNENALKLL